MHELSIAMSIVDIATEQAEQHAGRILAVHLTLGPLSGVIAEALFSAFDLACEGTPIAGSNLVIRETPIVAMCPTCKTRREIASPQWIVCPVCGTPTPEIVSGRELEITGLEITDDDDFVASQEYVPDAHRSGAPEGAQAE